MWFVALTVVARATAFASLLLLLRKAWVTLMNTVQSVHDQIAALRADISRLDALVRALHASPGPFTQADLDAFTTELTDAQSASSSIV